MYHMCGTQRREIPKSPPIPRLFLEMSPHPLSLLQLLFVVPFTFAANWTAEPFIPPATPLAVKTPYLQTWMMQGTAEGSLNSGWVSFRDGMVNYLPHLQRIPDTDRQAHPRRILHGRG